MRSKINAFSSCLRRIQTIEDAGVFHATVCSLPAELIERVLVATSTKKGLVTGIQASLTNKDVIIEKHDDYLIPYQTVWALIRLSKIISFKIVLDLLPLHASMCANRDLKNLSESTREMYMDIHCIMMMCAVPDYPQWPFVEQVICDGPTEADLRCQGEVMMKIAQTWEIQTKYPADAPATFRTFFDQTAADFERHHPAHLRWLGLTSLTDRPTYTVAPMYFYRIEMANAESDVVSDCE